MVVTREMQENWDAIISAEWTVDLAEEDHLRVSRFTGPDRRESIELNMPLGQALAFAAASVWDFKRREALGREGT